MFSRAKCVCVCVYRLKDVHSGWSVSDRVGPHSLTVSGGTSDVTTQVSKVNSLLLAALAPLHTHTHTPLRAELGSALSAALSLCGVQV